MVTSLASRGFGGAIGLFASAAGNLGGAHGNARTVQAQIHGGSHFAGWFHTSVFVSGDLGAQRFGGTFYLTGAYLYPCQFAQQTAALDKAHQRCRAAGHAQYSRRERKHLQAQMTVARTEPVPALGTVMVGPLQEQRPQHALKCLSVAAMILGRFSAGARQFWAGVIAGIGIQPLFERSCR